jgi:two-component system sensor histidine kinase CpxA
MTPTQQKTIFDAFTQADQSITRLYGGTGLGLAIAKNAIIAHGGSLALSNKEKGGLCANITLPLIKE